MAQRIRLFLFVEAVTFLAAALVHAGLLLEGAQHRAARNAELVIAVVLLGGLALSWIRPASTRTSGIAAQGFALVGTLVGIFTIIVGVGPQTVADLVYHVAIVGVLVWGLAVSVRARGVGARRPA